MASRSTKRGRKDKGVAPSGSGTLDPLDTFFDKEARAKFSHYYLKKLKYGRIVDEESHLNSFGLNVQTLFEFQGLDKFLATAMGVFPVLVREFYANLRHPYDARGKMKRDTLISRVNKTDIEFTESTLAAALEIEQSADQLNICSFSDVATIDPTFNHLAALNSICEAPRNSVDKVRTVELKLPCRIIHRIVIQAVNPRSGSFDQVPKIDAYLVSAIWSNKKINWAGLIFNLFKKGAKRKDANLVFGIALSKLFFAFDAVGTTAADPHTVDDYFTDTTIQRFGYEIQNGVWVKKRGAVPQDEPGEGNDDDSMGDDDDHEDNPDEQVPMDTQDPPIYPQVPGGVELMQAIQGLSVRNEAIYESVQSLHQDVRFLRQHIRRVDHRLNSFEDAYRIHNPGYFFPPPPDGDE